MRRRLTRTSPRPTDLHHHHHHRRRRRRRHLSLSLRSYFTVARRLGLTRRKATTATRRRRRCQPIDRSLGTVVDLTRHTASRSDRRHGGCSRYDRTAGTFGRCSTPTVNKLLQLQTRSHRPHRSCPQRINLRTRYAQLGLPKCPFSWGSVPPPNLHGFLHPLPVQAPDGTSIGSACDRQTQRQRHADQSIHGNNRPHLVLRLKHSIVN